MIKKNDRIFSLLDKLYALPFYLEKIGIDIGGGNLCGYLLEKDFRFWIRKLEEIKREYGIETVYKVNKAGAEIYRVIVEFKYEVKKT